MRAIIGNRYWAAAWLDNRTGGGQGARQRGITPLHSIIWVANQEGRFKKHGLDVEYLTMNSGTLGVQTLLSNESQLLFSTDTSIELME